MKMYFPIQLHITCRCNINIKFAVLREEVMVFGTFKAYHIFIFRRHIIA